MTVSILLVGALALAGPTVALKADVVVAGPELRVSDLVEARGMPLPVKVASRTVARVPRSADLPAASVAALVRRRVPGLAVEAPAPGMIVRIAVRTAPSVRRPANCFATARTVAAGVALTRPDVAATPCRADGAHAKLDYDRGSGALSSAAALPAATYLGQLPPLPTKQVAKGTVLTLRSAAGPVIVERTVRALQSAESGRGIFVRDDAGRVFAAPLALAPEAGR